MFVFFNKKGVLENWSMPLCYHLKVVKVKRNIKPRTDLKKSIEYKKKFIYK